MNKAHSNFTKKKKKSKKTKNKTNKIKERQIFNDMLKLFVNEKK